MGRSKESFSKKEREKKKQKKRKDKALKADERKANSKSDAPLEDLLAYVDAEGNLVETPPDPAEKIEIKVEDIDLSYKREKIPEEIERAGTVTFFNDDKGYGFIRDGKSQESIFVHANNLSEPITETDKVTFEIEMGPKGPNAVKVKLVKR